MSLDKDFEIFRRKCFESGKLFKDPNFQPSEKILSHESGHRSIIWRRPHEICANPRFVVDGFSRFDVHQGSLGDCWFLAALATLAENKQLFHKVVPENNSFDVNYSGVFHFRFWKCGKWILIIIDDRLPVHGGKLLFMKAPKWEFWPALLEKAYAKFYGSYGAIEGGFPSEAMIDFTGGIIERYVFRRPPPNLFSIILKSHERGSLISSCVNRTHSSTEENFAKGIVEGHAYSVTKAHVLNAGSKKEVKVVRIKNPWSNETEWNGPFADKSSEWNFVSEKVKNELKVQFCDDGEFWMTMTDFLEHFDSIEICHVSPNSLKAGDEDKKWNLSLHEGIWTSKINYIPQIVVKLVDPDEYDDDDHCSIVISLMQKNCRDLRSSNDSIRFECYQLSSEDAKLALLPNNFFLSRKPVGSHKMEPYREICARFRLMPGYYVIVPQTLGNKTGEFMMRIFTESMCRGTTDKVILKVNETLIEKSEPIIETKIEMFTINDVTPAAAAPRSSDKHFSFEFWFLAIVVLIALMLLGGAKIVSFLDQAYMSRN